MATYHEGELAAQESAGVRDAAARLQAAISDRVQQRAWNFLDTLGALAVSATAPDGHLWASLWVGQRGFVGSRSEGAVINVSWDRVNVPTDDPVRSSCAAGHPIGMLGIDFQTRQRVRVNGTVAMLDDHCMVVDVHESFLNCPKYIQRRASIRTEQAAVRTTTVRGDTLDRERLALLERADTAFIATTHPERGLDVSHRGGPPGFLRAVDERTIDFADYHGNNMFMTLGNLGVSPLAGLTVIDFDAARVVAMTGTARISSGILPLNGVETGRACTFSVKSWVEVPMSGDTSWSLVERSPFNPAPGGACSSTEPR